MSAPQHTPLVSIGMPVYNGETYLRQTLQSILGQTFRDFELIVCDNCSSDGTQTICEEYAAIDPRVRYRRNPRNLGAAPNYNLVFLLSSGQYFKWADHDDLIAPDFIERCVRALQQHPDVAVCFPRAKLIDKAGVAIGDYDPLPDTSSPEPHVRFRNLVLYNDHRLTQASGLIRSALLRKTALHGSYPCSDEVLFAHLALLGRYHEIPERLFLLRQHQDQSTRGVLASERARVLFFDSSLEGKAVLVKWPYFRDCLLAIQSSPIAVGQKCRCYLHVLRWLARRQNLRSTLKDAMLAFHTRVPVFPRLYEEVVQTAARGQHYR